MYQSISKESILSFETNTCLTKQLMTKQESYDKKAGVLDVKVDYLWDKTYKIGRKMR